MKGRKVGEVSESVFEIEWFFVLLYIITTILPLLTPYYQHKRPKFQTASTELKIPNAPL